MMSAARSPALKSESSKARASGMAISLKSEYVRRVFSLSRSDSIRQVSFGQRSSASRNAAPRHVYWSRFNMNTLFHHRNTSEAKLGTENCNLTTDLHLAVLTRSEVGWATSLTISPESGQPEF